MISFRPTMQALHKVFGRSLPDVELAAVDRWVIAPATIRHVPPAIFLPGQLDRMRGVAFGSVDEILHSLHGAFDAHEPETLGFHLREADLVDGVLYAARGIRNLRRRRRRRPAYLRPAEIATGALYESWVGNRWFGNWLSDDCLTYALAADYGEPVTTAPCTQGHMRSYEAKLGLQPRRVTSAHFSELIVFRDLGHNAGKAARADRARQRLMTGRAPATPHPGVFLLRGEAGERRMLANERAVADTLARRHGFTVVDPLACSVDGIVDVCAGARVVIGVEGSHLVHALMVMPRTATLLVIQPPDRVVSVLKMITDREGQTFAFVIGEGSSSAFAASVDEIDRTLDMVLH